MKGKFITFEGCEGVGKSHQVKWLCEYLDSLKIKYYVTREPGGSKLSERIRDMILDGKEQQMTDACEALLFSASRVQLLDEVIKGKLDEGYLVICDRFFDSSLAYQGYARGLGFDFIQKINDYAIKNFTPDLTLFLDLSPEQAFLRKGGADKNDRMELSGMEFHKKVYEGYKKLVEMYPNRIVDIDASGEKTETHNKIIKALVDRKII